MFGIFKKIRELNKQVEILELNLRLKQNEIDNLIKDQTDKVRNELVSFDFKAVKVFSIEREWDTRGSRTNIGYVLNDEVHEWHLFCSDEQHERLVKEFEKSRK